MLIPLNTKIHRQVGAILALPFQFLGRVAQWIWSIQSREKSRLANEMQQIRGLMPLLMRQRNGLRWSQEDLQEIKLQFRALFRLCPYLTLILMPGGFLILPFIAWWLDRRRQKRDHIDEKMT